MTTPPKTPTLTIDYEAYAHFLEHCDASEEEKREFLQALWNVICECVAMGFGVHPVQQALNAKSCGKLDKKACASTFLSRDMVESLDPEILHAPQQPETED